MQIFDSMQLPSGIVLKNRIIKAAMEENMATAQQEPGAELFTLYKAWSEGGMGAIITGNVMIDKLAMTGPAGVSLHSQSNLAPFVEWARISKSHGAKIIMQINHPGRQTYKSLGGKALSPSDVALKLGKHSSLFAKPKTMTEEEIQDVITRFSDTAIKAEEAGFDGVQIHAAHGYLLSQFLSPLVNKRTDKWGGDIKNRASLLLHVVQRVKEGVPNKFSVSVKLNSADFQRGGYDIDDAKYVVRQLEECGIDFIELSGGSYEAPAMQGRSADERTLDREAYFLEFAKSIAAQTSLNVMTTGGISRLDVARKVIAGNIDLVGIASAMAFNPNLVNTWINAPDEPSFLPKVQSENKTYAAIATMALIRRQLQRLGNSKNPKLNCSPLFSLIMDQLRIAKLTKRYRKHVIGDV